VSDISDLNPELKKLAYLGLLAQAPKYNFYRGMRCRKIFQELDLLAWNRELV
jgi:hypothetical protein